MLLVGYFGGASATEQGRKAETMDIGVAIVVLAAGTDCLASRRVSWGDGRVEGGALTSPTRSTIAGTDFHAQ